MNAPILPTPTALKDGLSIDLSNDYGILRADGVDAREFLHSQLTQAVQDLTTAEVRQGGYCSAKGRLYANLYLWADDDSVYLLMHHSVLPTVLKRLRMFVLRAKVVLEDISAQYRIHGYVSDDALTNTTRQAQRLGVLPAMVDDAAIAREIRLNPNNSNDNHTADASTTLYPATLWHWLDIQAGQPTITADISETFVPQMVNLDRIGGVNFKKGCYPGQEVVARSHYLGKLKRRMQCASITFTDAAQMQNALTQFDIGMDVYSSADPTQAAGQLVAFAVNPFNEKTIDVLYEVSLPLLENDAQLNIKGIETAWQHQPLPYAINNQ